MCRALGRSDAFLDAAMLWTDGHVPCPGRPCYCYRRKRLGRRDAPWARGIITTTTVNVTYLEPSRGLTSRLGKTGAAGV